MFFVLSHIAAQVPLHRGAPPAMVHFGELDAEGSERVVPGGFGRGIVKQLGHCFRTP